MMVSHGVTPVTTQVAPVNNFTVDNLRWLPGQTLFFAGGEAANATVILNCFLSEATSCPIGTGVDLVIPTTLQMIPVVQPEIIGQFTDGTGAVLEGSSLWLSSFRSDRVALVPFSLTPSQLAAAAGSAQ
jgi:hypothetical protein